MTGLASLEKAIKDLEKQKDELLRKIEENGWKDDRPKKKIPSYKKDITLALDNMNIIIEPEKSPLPREIGQIYQKWYNAVHVIIEKNQRGRISEIEEMHSSIMELIKSRYLTKEEEFHLMDLINFQFDILAAVPEHLKYSLYDIELTVYSVLMDDEVEAAKYLLKNGFLRAAGAIAGVTLERHLKNLLRKHAPPIKYKKKDTLSQLNDLCKEMVYDFVTWRKVQHLIDLRNLCDHDKEREPTKKEVRELIDGVSAILKETTYGKQE